jgi:CBS domain-containing protein
MRAEDAEVAIVRNQNPIMLPPSTTVMQAARRMHNENASAVLVLEAEGRLVGIFTGRDAVSRILAEGRDPTTTQLVDVMTYNPVITQPSHTAVEALRLMQGAYCRHLPIVDKGKVVGIISRGDFRRSEPRSG